MEGTNTRQVDENLSHDHTYYGKGCNSDWGTTGGSYTACSINTVTTADNETQRIGTYYHFQAATSGSGSDITSDYAVPPDTFCPLGWQLPYSGTGGDYYDKPRSYKYLLNSYDFDFGEDNAVQITRLRSYPFSYIYSGNYMWGSYGTLAYTGIHGIYWTSTNKDNLRAYRFYMWGKNLLSYDVNKFYGMTVRCVNNFSIPPSTARWQEPT